MRENTPTQIFIVGDGANLPGLSEYLTEVLGIPSKVNDPVLGLNMSKKLREEIGQISTIGFSVALGLALKSE